MTVRAWLAPILQRQLPGNFHRRRFRPRHNGGGPGGDVRHAAAPRRPARRLHRCARRQVPDLRPKARSRISPCRPPSPRPRRSIAGQRATSRTSSACASSPCWPRCLTTACACRCARSSARPTAPMSPTIRATPSRNTAISSSLITADPKLAAEIADQARAIARRPGQRRRHRG